MGGGWRSLLPRRTDLFDALRMLRYYVGVPFAKLMRRKWLHPVSTQSTTRSNAQHTSLFGRRVPSVATGVAIHKPIAAPLAGCNFRRL